jgi:hypothetical protein
VTDSADRALGNTSFIVAQDSPEAQLPALVPAFQGDTQNIPHHTDDSLLWANDDWEFSMANLPDRGASPFDAYIARPLLDTVIDMYFDYVYCLVPFPHPPSFLADYHGRRDLRTDQEEWSAMVLAMASFTISLVPHQILPGDKRSLRAIAVQSVNHARSYLAKPFPGPSLH